MFLLYLITNSPPYCGVPSLSHQFPVVTVVAVVVLVVVIVLVVVVVVLVVLDIVVDAVVDVVVFVAQDAKTRDVTRKQVSAIQMAPPFI